MFYVLDISKTTSSRDIVVDPKLVDDFDAVGESKVLGDNYADEDIDLVDDSLLNTTPHNAIERQLLNGDMIGLALMSGAIIWSAMGAF
ncbi:hypothetical protein [Hansschlegelia sp. KR7-227]|jgi:hypothetical protein|uniref:hypothetical protein n=1 Tax=Hansschlegelia sp. KR7-227 TaxID=3400914 RepID=UPI003C06F634